MNTFDADPGKWSRVSESPQLAKVGLVDQLKTAGRQQRAEIADLFNKISACPAATSSEIRAGEITHGRWVS